MALLTPELLRRLEQFQLLAARRAKSSARGERRSRARGQSVEFADYRTYVPGDDFRYLDWNLYGRLERLFLKLYEEERELPVRIFLDASESMTFGDLRLVDSETGAMQEVTFGRYRLKGYQQTVQNFIQRLREFCQGRGINYFTVSSNTSLEELLLKQLRQAEVWG